MPLPNKSGQSINILMNLDISGYCFERPLEYAGATWPIGILYSIGEGIQATCTAGYMESAVGPPKAICSANNSRSAIWSNYTGACKGISL